MTLVRDLADVHRSYQLGHDSYEQKAAYLVASTRREYGGYREEKLKQSLNLRNGGEPDFEAAYQSIRESQNAVKTDPIMNKSR